MNWSQFITPSLLVLVAFVYAVGLFLKRLPAFRSNWALPLILWGVGIAASLLVMVIQLKEPFAAVTILDGFIQGTIVAAAAVFGNQLYKQTMVKRVQDRKG